MARVAFGNGEVTPSKSSCQWVSENSAATVLRPGLSKGSDLWLLFPPPLNNTASASINPIITIQLLNDSSPFSPPPQQASPKPELRCTVGKDMGKKLDGEDTAV